MKGSGSAVKSKRENKKKSFKSGEKHEEAFELPAPEVPDEQLFVVDKKGDAGVKATTESWRAKPLKTDLALDVLMGKTEKKTAVVKAHKPKRGREPVPTNPPNARPARAGLSDLWEHVEEAPVSEWHEHWVPATKKERDVIQSKKRQARPSYVPPAAAQGVFDSRSLSNGLSYRPDPESHQDALGEATAYEVKAAEEAKRLKRVLQVKKGLPDDSLTEAKTLQEMVEFVRGGMQVSTEAPGEEASDEAEQWREKVGHKSKRAKKRKLDAVRKRSLKQKRKERLGKQIEHLGLIVREVDKEQERQEAADLAKEEKRVQRHSDTRRVGRAKFQPSRPAVLLESDLPASFRTMGNNKPLQGNRVAEMFESLQRRNIVSITKKQSTHKRHPVKRFERPSDKQAWAQIEKTKFGEFL